MLGKIYNDKTVLYKPAIMEKDGTIIDPYTDEQAIVDGYKTVIDKEEPSISGDIIGYNWRWVEESASVVKEWTPIYKPQEPAPPTPKQLREEAYKTMTLIGYEGKTLTCDEAQKLFYHYYCEEGKDAICAELKELITNAKESIRAMYPDESGDEGGAL